MRRLTLVVLLCCGCDSVWGLLPVRETPDAAASIDGIPACWPFAPSNYNPCSEFPPSLGPGITGQMIDTSAMPTYGTGVVLLHYDDVTIAAGQKLTIVGANPVVIVADGVIRIAGTIVVST